MKKYWGVFCFDQFEFSIFASKKSTTNRFVSRNANFSGKVWPWLRPAGSQGKERIWDDDGDNIAILVILTRMSDASWKWPQFLPGGNELLVIQGIIRLLNRNYLDPGEDWWWLFTIQLSGSRHHQVPPLPPRTEGFCRRDQHRGAEHSLEDQVMDMRLEMILKRKTGILFSSNKH